MIYCATCFRPIELLDDGVTWDHIEVQYTPRHMAKRPMPAVDHLDGRPYLDVHDERVRAHAKHQDKPGGSMETKAADDPDWFPVLTEEVGEVAKEINDYRHGLILDDDRMPRLRKELIQVAAMACAWIAAIDKWEPR